MAQKKGHRKEMINDYDTAMKYYNKGIRFNKKSALLFWRRGSLYHRKENYSMAIADFTKAIAVDSAFNDGYLYWSRALSREASGDLAGALSDFDQAVVINPEKSNFYFFRGVLKYNMKDLSGALTDYNAAIDLWDNYYLARSWRAIVRVQLKDFNGAMEDFDYLDFSEKEKLKPRMASQFRYRGIAKLKTGDLSGACNDWKVAAQHLDTVARENLKRYCE